MFSLSCRRTDCSGMSTAVDHVCLAGWACVDITPDVPCWMAGYAARSSPANSVHDPLEAHALALGTPTNAFIVVVCDLLAVDERLVEAVRDRVQAECPGASVWLLATHTHSGPDIGGPMSEHPPDPRVTNSIRSEEHTSELQLHSFISYAAFCLKKKITDEHTSALPSHSLLSYGLRSLQHH